MDVLTLKIPVEYPMTDDELFAYCSANKELRIERDSQGQLIVMSPAGSYTSNLNFKLNSIFGRWVEAHAELGFGFDSSAGFTLPDGSMRSPDISWISKEKWNSIPQREKEKFAPVCPDFVIELRSKSDSIAQLKLKMEDWIKNGCTLAWLIDPIDKQAYVYKSDNSIQVMGFNAILPGEQLLPEFSLDLSLIH